ncbi:hypothetical protein [Peribacillus muralis]|uniref:hypothetical protein n=1 Tax=Peribacillus muralis TaxID=264697 RepID=UPI003D049682
MPKSTYYYHVQSWKQPIPTVSGKGEFASFTVSTKDALVIAVSQTLFKPEAM